MVALNELCAHIGLNRRNGSKDHKENEPLLSLSAGPAKKPASFAVPPLGVSKSHPSGQAEFYRREKLL